MSDAIERLKEIADQECTCTEQQQTGEDPTLCNRCEVAGLLNSLYEEAEAGLRKVEEVTCK